jgi:hypothetical protein
MDSAQQYRGWWTICSGESGPTKENEMFKYIYNESSVAVHYYSRYIGRIRRDPKGGFFYQCKGAPKGKPVPEHMRGETFPTTREVKQSLEDL